LTGVLTSPPVVTLTAYIPTSVSSYRPLQQPSPWSQRLSSRSPRLPRNELPLSSSSSHLLYIYACYVTQCVGGVIGRKGQKVEDLQRRAAKAATTRLPVRVSVV
jgi:hypothetical protein